MKILISVFLAILSALALVGCTQTPEENIVFTTPKGYPAPVKSSQGSSWQDHLELAIERGMEAEAAAGTMSEAVKTGAVKASAPTARHVLGNRAAHSKKAAGRRNHARKHHFANR